MKFVVAKISPFLINWKTSLLGLSMVAGGVSGLADHLVGVSDGKPLTFEAIQIELAAIAAGVGLIMARDADKSSQDSTIRK
jgi:hypothetical protein